MKILNYCCCFNNPINQLNYVRFQNVGDYTIKCIIQYSLGSRTATEEATLHQGSTKKFNLPPNASNICLNILNLSEPDPFKSVIYHDCISGQENICYRTYNTAQQPMVEKLIC